MKVEKFTNMLGIAIRLIVIDPLEDQNLPCFKSIKIIICRFMTPPPQKKKKPGWLYVFKIYVVSVIFQPYRDLEARGNKSLKL